MELKYFVGKWGVIDIEKDPINETNLEPMIRAYELLKDELSGGEKWRRRVVTCEMESVSPQKSPVLIIETVTG